MRKESHVSANKNNDNSNTSTSHNAPRLVEPTANTMPITHCQNQQQVSNTENSNLNDGDLILQPTERDNNQQSYGHALCVNGLRLSIPTRITNRVYSQQQTRKLRGKFRKKFNRNHNQVFRKRLSSPRAFRQPKYPKLPRKDSSKFSGFGNMSFVETIRSAT